MRDKLPGLNVSRRDFMKLTAAGVTATAASGWLNILAARAAQQQAQGQAPRHKRCILLWMDGGPSHKDTFDLKPGTEHGGPYQQIQTAAPGVQISEYFPQVARVMNHGVIIRSMSTGEGAHGRAKYFLHTGYREGVGGLTYPSIGSIASMEIGNQESPLPNFVSIGNRVYGAGFLGARHQPLVVADPTRGVENLRPATQENQFNNRVDLLEELENGFHRQYGSTVDAAHHTTYQRAVTLMRDQGAQAFELSRETDATRQRYGNTTFGNSCLLARRLVEAGVSFVEVSLGGWDTHQNNFERVRQLSGQVDPAMSSLVTDLNDRGLLNDTLVIWMGEFGRTPRINARSAQPGRDHYPRAWSSVMFGGGIRGGQVYGATDAEGATVSQNPVDTLAFMATVCRTLGIDYTKFNQSPIGRPIRIVDRGGQHIQQIIG